MSYCTGMKARVVHGQVAETYRNEPGMWFPHTLDFRGRAYPMPPHLNHMGPDSSRGVMRLAEGRALGEHGLDWLYVQASSQTYLAPVGHLKALRICKWQKIDKGLQPAAYD